MSVSQKRSFLGSSRPGPKRPTAERASVTWRSVSSSSTRTTRYRSKSFAKRFKCGTAAGWITMGKSGTLGCSILWLSSFNGALSSRTTTGSAGGASELSSSRARCRVRKRAQGSGRVHFAPRVTRRTRASHWGLRSPGARDWEGRAEGERLRRRAGRFAFARARREQRRAAAAVAASTRGPRPRRCTAARRRSATEEATRDDSATTSDMTGRGRSGGGVGKAPTARVSTAAVFVSARRAAAQPANGAATGGRERVARCAARRNESALHCTRRLVG